MKNILQKTLSIMICLVFLGSTYQCQRDEDRMDWWREARFGMFIHWGIYSIPAG